MFSTNTCLRELIEPVPVCSESADLATAFEVLGWAGKRSSTKPLHERLVLINEQQHPVGVIHLRQLLPYLIENDLARKSSSRKTAKTIKLSPTSQPIEPSIIEPVNVVLGELPVGQFLVSLRNQNQFPCAVVGDRGEFLGLLNCDRLLRLLSQNLLGQSALTQQTDSASALGTSVESKRQKAANRQQRQTVWLSQQLLAQKLELKQQVKSQHETIRSLMKQQVKLQSVGELRSPFPLVDPPSSLLNSLNSLLELLEQLPLPLMLQTEDGQTIAQNAVWRRQVEEWVDPGWIGQQVSTLLETSAVEKSSTPGQSSISISSKPFLSSISVKETQFSSCPLPSIATVQTEFLPANGSDGSSEPNPVSSGLCHIGSKPGTCVCVFPLRNGQEQAMQFVKVPIEKLTEAEKETATSGVLWLILAQDITEQQQLARELTAKNVDLIQLNRLKDEFLACISHELRTPLTAVLGLSSLLKDQTLGEMNQRQVHYAQLIYQSGRHLMAVVNDILDLTRMETGQLELVPEPVNISMVCSRALEQAKQLRMIENKQTSPDDAQLPQFSLEVEPGLMFLVADEQRLRQMLIHLLTNAFKFTEPGQSTGLKVNRWGGWIAFTVWDTGIGIPADKQHLIFQKFQQLENPLTRRFEGTGLGLVLTQRLARLHGGDVTFISKEGQGSQFTILLPPNPPEGTTIASNKDELLPPSPNYYPGGKVLLSTPNQSVPHWSGSQLTGTKPDLVEERLRQRLVLVVEAAPSFIETLTDQLIGLGYRVVNARSGTEALEKARRLQPCIIFLNPVLPSLSGWDVLTLLKSSPETRQIPVVVTATQVDEAHTHRSYADSWLNLPIQAKALRNVMRQLVTESVKPATSRQSSGSTILRLSPGTWINDDRAIPDSELTQLLHSQHYRVLEADDLEQAELLARVWKPNVILLDGTLVDPIAYFQQFSQHTFLSSLPLVTLNQEATQAANQILGLLVFPCLASLTATSSTTEGMETSALLQVIQIAIGYTWRPSILAFDIATLPSSLDAVSSQSSSNETLGSFPKESEWLQALAQYLQTAGLRGLVGRSCQEVLQQLQSQSVDLLLICWTEHNPLPSTLTMLSALQQVEARPPILVLDHRDHRETNQLSTVNDLPKILQQLAAQILPPSLAMEELLNRIYQALKG